MRYFLKKTNRPKGEYLQIYQSEYIRGVGSRNKSYKAIGYVDELIARGTKDPVAKAQAEVKRLNDELKAKEDGEKARKIGKSSPQRFLGYFVLKAVANSLGDFEKRGGRIRTYCLFFLRRLMMIPTPRFSPAVNTSDRNT